jgi:hypothetical protein
MMPVELPEAWRDRIVKPAASTVATVPAVFKPCTPGGSPYGRKALADEREKRPKATATINSTGRLLRLDRCVPAAKLKTAAPILWLRR